MSVNTNDYGQFPYEIKAVEPELDDQIRAGFPDGSRSVDFVQVGPQKWFLRAVYAGDAKNYYNFKFRKDDVVIVSFPRSGTTLTQEMTWIICNNFNYETAAEQLLNDRFPFLEYEMVKPKSPEEEKFSTENTNKPMTHTNEILKKLVESTNKRFIKTHLPFSLLSPVLTEVGCKIIYLARDPKDVVVSYFHLRRLFSNSEQQTGDIGKFWDLFTHDLSLWCPYWEHIKEGWGRKDEKNVLFMFYEDMIKDLKSTIKKVASFLEKPCTIEDVEKLANHLNIDNFRKNKSVNFEYRTNLQVNKEEKFIRKGKTGGWRDHFDEEWEKRANEWIEKNLKDTDLKFPV